MTNLLEDLRIQAAACYSASQTYDEGNYRTMQEHGKLFSEAADEIESLENYIKGLMIAYLKKKSEGLP